MVQSGSSWKSVERPPPNFMDQQLLREGKDWQDWLTQKNCIQKVHQQSIHLGGCSQIIRLHYYYYYFNKGALCFTWLIKAPKCNDLSPCLACGLLCCSTKMWLLKDLTMVDSLFVSEQTNKLRRPALFHQFCVVWLLKCHRFWVTLEALSP